MLIQVSSDRIGRCLPLLAWMSVLLAGISSVATASEETTKPNVLFVAVDDLAAVAGCYGHPLVKTPHLDRLAAKGVRFDRAYCQIPLCNPSRASVLTGMRPDRTRVYDLARHFRDEMPHVLTLPQLFRGHGWQVARVGKIYHADVPNSIGTSGLDDSTSWQTVVNPKGRDVLDAGQIINPTPERPISAALSWLAAEGRDEEQTDGLIAGSALQLLSEAAAAPADRPSGEPATPAAAPPVQTPDTLIAGRPFFLSVGFFRPHTPFVAPRKYFDMYPLDQIHLPETPAGDRDDVPAAAFAHNCRVPHYGLDEQVCRQALQAYFASVSFVDAQFGRLLDALDTLELAENTIVVVWSDHGYHLGEHGGIWQKRTLFEPSARVPLLIYVPDAILRRTPTSVTRSGDDDVRISRVRTGQANSGNGQSCARIVELIDLYPTLAELCGLKPPATANGRSLVPLLRDPGSPWDATAVTQILRPGREGGPPIMGRSIRTDRWRYTEWNEGRDGRELYDHWNDPQEYRNLAAEADFQAVVSGLRKEFQRRAEGQPPVTPFRQDRL